MTEKPFRHVSDYRDRNYHIDHRADTLCVCLTYPSRGTHDPQAGVSHVEINQESVRSSDGVRLHYDYDRDGWVIEQPTVWVWHESDTDCDEGWGEVAFVRSWAFAS